LEVIVKKILFILSILTSTTTINAIPGRFWLFPTNTPRRTFLGFILRKKINHEIETKLRERADAILEDVRLNGISQNVPCDERIQKIGRWAYSQMGIPLSEQSEILALNKFIPGKGLTILQVIREKYFELEFSRIYVHPTPVSSAKQDHIPLGETIYTLLHESAHKAQLPLYFWTRNGGNGMLASLPFAYLIQKRFSYAMHPLTKITGRLVLPALTLIAAKTIATRLSTTILESDAERKTLKKIDCPDCLTQAAPNQADFPYNSPEKLIRKAIRLEITGKGTRCPFHSEKESTE